MFDKNHKIFLETDALMIYCVNIAQNSCILCINHLIHFAFQNMQVVVCLQKFWLYQIGAKSYSLKDKRTITRKIFLCLPHNILTHAEGNLSWLVYLRKKITAGMETSPVTTFLTISAKFCLVIFWVQEIQSVKCCPYICKILKNNGIS